MSSMKILKKNIVEMKPLWIILSWNWRKKLVHADEALTPWLLMKMHFHERKIVVVFDVNVPHNIL